MRTNQAEDKVALVTGASRGIGRATALALASAGTRVIIHYGRSASDADSLRKQIQAVGGLAETVAADLASPDGIPELAEQVRQLAGDRLDILVANAGISKAASIEDHTVQDFDALFATNVRAPFFLVQQLLPLLSRSNPSLGAGALLGRLQPLCATNVLGSLKSGRANSSGCGTRFCHPTTLERGTKNSFHRSDETGR